MNLTGYLRMLCLLVVSSAGMLGQNVSEVAAAGRSQAATITHAEIEDALRVPPKTGIKDVALRVVPVGGEYNVGVFVVRRSLVNGKMAADAYQHHDITEVYQVVSGSGTLVTGGTLEDAKEMPPNDPSVVRLMGPTAGGVAIKGGTTQHIGPGDMVIIPANTPHGFVELAPEGISYVVMRVDAQRVLKAR